MKNFFERVGLQFFAEDGGEVTEPQEQPTNQDEGLEDSGLDGFEDGFGDDYSEEPTPEPQPQIEQNIAQAQQTAQQTAQQFVTVPYNGKSVNVPLDALTALNNVFGGNIGQILERGLAPQQPVQPQKPNEAELLLDAYAKAAGFSDRQAYMQAMQQQLNNFEVQNEIKNLQMKYPDTPQEALFGLAQQTVQNRHQQQANQRVLVEQQIQKHRQTLNELLSKKANAEKVRPFLEFYKQYPEVKKDTLSPQFFDLVKGGLHPSAAYERLQAEQYKAQLAAINKNQQNAATSIGSMQGSNVSSDSFLSGFGI